MVEIRLDYEDEDWPSRARRCLRAGAVLVGVPEDGLHVLESIEREATFELVIRNLADGWSAVRGDSGRVPRGGASR